MPNPLVLIQNRQAANRAAFAQKQEAYQRSQESQLTGRILGTNAETGRVEVRLDSGGILPCKTITNGNLKVNSSAIISLNGSTAWVDAMPS